MFFCMRSSYLTLTYCLCWLQDYLLYVGLPSDHLQTLLRLLLLQWTFDDSTVSPCLLGCPHHTHSSPFPHQQCEQIPSQHYYPVPITKHKSPCTCYWKFSVTWDWYSHVTMWKHGFFSLQNSYLLCADTEQSNILICVVSCFRQSGEDTTASHTFLALFLVVNVCAVLFCLSWISGMSENTVI